MEPTVIGYMKEQPEVLKKVLQQANVFVEPFLEMFTKYDIKKIIFFGSGTSYNVSLIAAYYFKHIAGIAAEAQYPTVFYNYEKPDWTGMLKEDQILFVGISQSGTSISTIDVMKHAKEKGYHTLVLTGNLDSEITKHVDVKTHLLVGDELTPPETKGYTVSLLSVYLWALHVAKGNKTIDAQCFAQHMDETKTFIDQFQTIIEESEAWYDRNKTSIVNSDRIFVLGYGIDFGTAIEAQLKIGEMLRLPTLGYEIEEYSHGPTMAIAKNQTIFMIGSQEAEYERMLFFRKAFKKYTDRVHVITCVECDHDERDMIFSVKANKYLAPLMYTVPFQFVAAKGAKDIQIDTGKNPFEEPLAHLEK